MRLFTHTQREREREREISPKKKKEGKKSVTCMHMTDQIKKAFPLTECF